MGSYVLLGLLRGGRRLLGGSGLLCRGLRDLLLRGGLLGGDILHHRLSGDALCLLLHTALGLQLRNRGGLGVQLHLHAHLEHQGHVVVDGVIADAEGGDHLPDDAAQLKTQLLRLADARQVNLILTTGGTGFAPRDITPEATYAVADRNAPGIAEAMRYHSLSITPRGMLSRAASVLRGKTLIVNLPGSPKAVKENLEYILPSLEHGVRIAAGLDGECARK